MVAAVLAGCFALSLATVASSGEADAQGFLASPKSGKGPGVLVLHPWWGLNEDVKTFCQRLADAGFVAYAPDLFQGKTATTPDQAEALIKEFERKHLELKAQISQAAKYLSEQSGKSEIAVVGFSFGAYYALYFSNAEPARVKATVVFYGTGHEDFSKSKSAYLGHFAEKDDFEPKAAVDGLTKLLKDVGRPTTIHTYPNTGHWFFEPSIKQAYDKSAAELAWERTLAFLKESLLQR